MKLLDNILRRFGYVRRPLTTGEKSWTILNTISEHLGISVKEILSHSKRRDDVEARYIAMHFIKSYSDLTLVQVGRFMKRDHSTVISAKKQVSDWLETDSNFKMKFKYIENVLKKKI